MHPVSLYGRDAELVRLADLLANGRAIAVVGEAGVGKTTLVRAAAERAGLELREGGALETLAWTPLLALRRAVGDGLRGDATAVAIEVERRLGPQLLFIDDLQWTDDATRQVLALLTGRVALVMTIRATDPAASEVHKVAEEVRAEIFELVGVDPAAAIAIARRARPTIDAAAEEVVVAQAGGNPLLLEELASHGRPTSSLARALTGRIDRLSAAGRRSFALLAVAGHGLSAEMLGPGAAELLSTGVAVESDGFLVPRHALLAEAMLGTLTPEAIRRCHDRLAMLIADPGERAYHLAGSGRRQEALAAAQDAAYRASSPGERASLLELAARMSEGSGAILQRITASRLLLANGGSASARAIELLEPIVEGPVDLLVERDALLGKAYWDAGDLINSRAAYERGRRLDAGLPIGAELPFATGASLAAGEAAFVMNVDGDVAMASRILGRAIASGRSTPRVVATYETIRAFIEGVDTFDAVRTAYESLLSDPDDPGAAFGTAHNVADLATLGRGHAAAHAFLVRAVEDFAVRDMAGRADDLRGEDIQVLLFAGRLEEALRLADELLERPLVRRTRQWTMIKRVQVLAEQGQSDAAAAALDAITASVTSDYAGRGELLAARVQVESWAGRPAAALEAYEAHLAVPTPSRATDIMPLLEAQWARLELGIDPGPAVLRQPWTMLAAASSESEGIRALFLGDPAVAATSFADAWTAWAPFHVGRELMCRWAGGESLRRAGSAKALAVLREALARAESLGFGSIAARIRRSLRQAGVRVAPPRKETDVDRWARMTGREREVLQLVGRGMTTPQIARRMGLGRGTIDQVLGAATRKLGAASRIQAAAMLADGEGGSSRARRLVSVRNEADAGAVVLAALQGAAVTVDSATDPALVERIQDDLRRLGRDDAVRLEPVALAAQLTPEGLRLLSLLVEGMSLGEAAGSLHLSRRTADRRLAAARLALGAATTAEALITFQRRWLGPPD
jgi:DNA-binding NarL/FixJ family response regulator